MVAQRMVSNVHLETMMNNDLQFGSNQNQVDLVSLSPSNCIFLFFSLAEVIRQPHARRGSGTDGHLL